jgi:hypothetical protein
VLGSKLDPETSYAEGFRDFPKFLWADAGIVPSDSLRLLPHTL